MSTWAWDRYQIACGESNSSWIQYHTKRAAAQGLYHDTNFGTSGFEYNTGADKL